MPPGPPPSAEGGGRGGFDAATTAHHAAVLVLGTVRGDVAGVEVALHLVDGSIQWIAVTGAAGQTQFEDLIRR